jgi:hypothetical protein
VVGANLFWEKSTAVLLVVDLFSEKNTDDWWLISQAKSVNNSSFVACMHRYTIPIRFFCGTTKHKMQGMPRAYCHNWLFVRICPVRLAGGWWLVLICSEKKVLLADCWCLVYSERNTAGWWLISQTIRVWIFGESAVENHLDYYTFLFLRVRLLLLQALIEHASLLARRIVVTS